MRHSRLAALCLLLAAALLVIPGAVVAVGARSLDPSPIRRQVAASSSSSSTSASVSPSPSTSVGDAQNVTGAASGGNKSTSSYINWQLPDTFVQCQPALISFSAVFGAKDEDALGGTLKKAISNTWINLRIKPTTGDKGISEDLSSNATSWLWDKVNFPAGTNFEVLITALTNITIDASNSSTSSSSSKGKGSSDTAKHAAARRRSILLGSTKSSAAATDDDISPVVIARAFARSNVVAGTLNDTSCLSTTTPSNGTEANSFGHGGSLAGPAGNPLRGSHSGKAGDRTVVIVAAFLGGLCGLFVALVGALAWHKRKDQKRLRGMAEARQGGYSHAIQMARRSGAFAMDNSSPRPTSQYAGAQNGAAAAGAGGAAAGARSSAVPLWDGGYRDGPSAGWGYMASLVPGLAPQAPPAFTSPTSSPIDGTFAALRGRRNRNRLLPTNRRAEEGEEDLPSYGKSEAEIRDLPSYEAGFLAGLASLQQQQALQAAQHRQRGGYDASTPGVEPATYEDAAGGASGAAVANPDGSFADERAGLLTTVAEESSLYDDNASNSSGSLGRSASNATSRTIPTGAAAFQAPPPAEVGRNVTMGSIDRQQQHLRRHDSTSSSGSGGSGAWRLEERPTLPPIQTSGQLFGRDSQDDVPPTVTTMRSPFDDDVAGGQGHSSITIMDDDGAHGGATTPTATTGYEARPGREGSDGSDGAGGGSMAARRRSRGGSQSQAIFDGLSALNR